MMQRFVARRLAPLHCRCGEAGEGQAAGVLFRLKCTLSMFSLPPAGLPPAAAHSKEACWPPSLISTCAPRDSTLIHGVPVRKCPWGPTARVQPLHPTLATAEWGGLVHCWYSVAEGAGKPIGVTYRKC
jgi:hypothetical protein